MPHLTEHFTLEELTHSDLAVRQGIANRPSSEVVANLKLLAQKLEQVRTILGQSAVTISSGYRCPELNTRIGGSRTSAHLHGLAADFKCPGFGSPAVVCRAIQKHASLLCFDQLIYEGTWCHISFVPGDMDARGDVLTASFSGGRASYTRGIIG
ncbi:MAG: D-Ala-D-Ala carboxypeptidase family metallohydrolase, partial [Magnetococcus sp. YQC-3]